MSTKHSIRKAVEEVLSKETSATRKPWIDGKTLELRGERRRYKNAKDKQGKINIRDLGTKCRENAEKHKITRYSKTPFIATSVYRNSRLLQLVSRVYRNKPYHFSPSY